ncbi:MAG TPA: hypothetical protein VGO59_10795 [Verrucomicrobiae bacterium]|jgi:hypothetical protein
MKRIVLAWLALLALPLLAPCADKTDVTFYLQLIRGTDDDKPPATEARMAGPEVRRRLQMFKWKNYWEMSRRTVVLGAGSKTRQRMSARREVEILRGAPREITVCIYADGKLTRRRKQSVDTPFYIAGGDKDASQSWFIVVRRDKPPGDQANLR